MNRNAGVRLDILKYLAGSLVENSICGSALTIEQSLFEKD